jgi:hypothetical protein
MYRMFVPAAVAAVLCLSAALAGAQQTVQHSGSDDAQAACTPDVFRLCSAEIPSETRIVACLKQKKAKLSPGCRKIFS